MRRYAIVAIGYNRPNSMTRLLRSVAKAEFEGDVVDLIISIDNSGTTDVEDCAKSFDWTHGEKRIVTYPERQGLRKHILNCGNFLADYDAIAVLEDDIVVSPAFYQYMKATVEKYIDNDNIAGISLYAPEWNKNVQLPFAPSVSDSDVYFMQRAQSWGQIWLKKQWTDFKEWYQSIFEQWTETDQLPKHICGWKETSWLKYHIRYCVEKNKYFVYPYHSVATCFADAGQHYDVDSSIGQVVLLQTPKKEYVLHDFDDPNAVKYDVFHEYVSASGKYDDIDLSDVCFDLYGSKINYGDKKYVVSSVALPYKIIAEFGCSLRPHEQNIIYGLPGNSYRLYALEETDVSKKLDNTTGLLRYHLRLYNNAKKLMKYVMTHILGHLKNNH